MLTIKKNSIYNYEIKKSKFITLLYKVETLEEIDKLITQTKKNYQNATHCCFAYKLLNNQKFSDDGEPGGTAGLPIMEVINKKNLDFILCIVVRYFGGIKLGAGGLVRAYSKATNEALENNSIIELTEGYTIKIEVNYDEQKQLDYLFLNKIKNKEFKEKVIYYINVNKDDLSSINYKYEILNNIWIEKSSN